MWFQCGRGVENRKITYILLHGSVLLSVYESHTPGTRSEPASQHAHSPLVSLKQKIKQHQGWSLGQHRSCTTVFPYHHRSNTYGALLFKSMEGSSASCTDLYLMEFYAGNNLCLTSWGYCLTQAPPLKEEGKELQKCNNYSSERPCSAGYTWGFWTEYDYRIVDGMQLKQNTSGYLDGKAASKTTERGVSDTWLWTSGMS